MPYLMETITKDIHDHKVVVGKRPSGAEIPPEIAVKAAKAELWGSSFSDPGPDYCEVRLFDEQGAQFKTARIEGY